MPATCWRLATSDTPSTRSPSLSSVTISLETCVAVSLAEPNKSQVSWRCLSVDLSGLSAAVEWSFFFLPLRQTWPTCLSMTMMVPVGVPRIRTLSPLCPIPGQPPGPWPCPTSSPFHTRTTCRSPSTVDRALAVQEASTVVSEREG